MILANWLGRLWSDLCKMAKRRSEARRGSRPRRRRDIFLVPAIERLEPLLFC